MICFVFMRLEKYENFAVLVRNVGYNPDLRIPGGSPWICDEVNYPAAVSGYRFVDQNLDNARGAHTNRGHFP